MLTALEQVIEYTGDVPVPPQSEGKLRHLLQLALQGLQCS
jgi:hypothetical protein